MNDRAKSSSTETPDDGNSERDRLSTKCSGCQRVVKAPPSLAGANLPCPTCGQTVRIPKPKSKIEVSERSSDSDETPDHRLRRELAKAIHQALRLVDAETIERETSNDSIRRGKLKKLIQVLERSVDNPRDYRKLTDARQAIQTIVELESQTGGDAIVGFLTRCSGKLRLEAIQAIGKLKVSTGYEAILRELLSSEPSEVEAAIRAVGNYGSSTSVKALIYTQCLHPEHRIRVASSIAKIGQSALSDLVGLLDPSSSDSVRFAALEAIKGLRSPQAIEVLLTSIQRDDGPFRIAAIEALVEIQDAKVIRPLVELTKDNDSHVRGLAVSGLARIRDKKMTPVLVSAIDDPDQAVQLKAIEGLGESGEKSIVPKIARFLESPDQAIQFAAAEAISRLGDKRVVPVLLKLLDLESHGDRNSEQLLRLVRNLQRFRDPRSVLPLCHLLDSDDAKLRRRVVESLGSVGDPAARPALERVLQRDSADEVRASAAKALGDLGDPAAIETLTVALHEPSEVRLKALVALSRLKAANSLPMIREMLIDPLPQIRYQVANLLGEVGDTSAIADLEQLVADDDPMVTRAALKSLQSLGDQRSETEIVKAYKKSKRAKKRDSSSTIATSSWSGFLTLNPGGRVTVAGCLILSIVVGLAAWWSSSGDAAPEVAVVRGYVDAIGVSVDGAWLVACRNRGMTEVWDTKAGTRVWMTSDLPRGKGVVVSEELKTILIATSRNVSFFDFDSSGTLTNPVEITGHEKPIVQTTATTDRKFAATVDTAGIVRVWDMAQRRTTTGLTIPDKATAIALEQSGRILVAGGGGMGLQAWSLESTEILFDSNKVGRISSSLGEVTSVAVSPDSQYLAIALASGTIQVYDFDRERILSEHEITSGRPMLAFNPENELIIINRKLYRLSDIKRGSLEAIGPAVENRSTFNFSPATNEMFLASDDASHMTIIDVRNGQARKLDL